VQCNAGFLFGLRDGVDLGRIEQLEQFGAHALQIVAVTRIRRQIVELVRICLKIEQLRRMTGMVDVFQRAERSRVTPPGEQVAWYSDSTGSGARRRGSAPAARYRGARLVRKKSDPIAPSQKLGRRSIRTALSSDGPGLRIAPETLPAGSLMKLIRV
jgi:hypothetical protein